MSNEIRIDDTFEKYFTYLCLTDSEQNGRLADAFVNFSQVNENYMKTYEDILESGAENVRMVFQDRHAQCIVTSLTSEGFGSIQMESLKPSSMAKTYPEYFLDGE